MKRRLISAALVVAVVLLGARLTRPALLEGYDFSRAVVDRDGNLLRLTLASDDAYRLHTSLSAISPELVESTLLYEDRYFYWHPGFNPVALVKAFATTYVTQGRRRGGSTLTMQLARLRFHIDSKTPGGKLLQVLRAVQLELGYSKAELLEAYLDLAPYGGNVYGVGAASRVYFHKDAKALALPEAMALAVMPQSPSARQPGSTREPEPLKSARLKLAAMYREAHPGVAPETLALDAPLELSTTKELPFLAPHAVEAALRARSEIDRAEIAVEAPGWRGARREHTCRYVTDEQRSRPGWIGRENDRSIPLRAPGGRPTGTLTVTLDRALQAQLERQLSQYVARRAAAGLRNAAALVVDADTSEVLAHVGSADFFDDGIHGQVDGVSARRSPGSALKSVVYARALDEGLIQPLTLLKDVPMRFGSYNPENFDSDYLGPLTAQDALVKSRNVPAVELNLRLEKGLYEVLADVGVKGLKEKPFYGAGIVLGAVEVSMEELAQLYVALAHGGQWRPLKRLRDEPPSPPRRLVSPEAAELTLSMLSSAESSMEKWTTPRDAVPVAWKTGTSYAYRDAWTVGVAGRYVIAVWVGNFDGQPNPSFVGRGAAAPLFFEVVDGLRPRLATPAGRREAVPVNLTEATVCAVSGKRPGPYCAHTVRTRVIPGVSPIEACDVHRVVHLDDAGRRRCEAVPGKTHDEVYEVWPSDVARLFERAGLARRALPVALEPCPGEDAVSERPPHILSPQPEMTYELRRDKPEEGHLQLLAHADGAARAVTWFAGAEMLGTVAPGKTLEWAAPSGRHELRAVDDRGHVARVSITVHWLE